MHEYARIARGRLAVVGLACLALVGATAGPALADKRVALVVGNAAYRNVPKLDNPVNDAKLMAETLKGVGFTLIGGGAQLDLDKAGFDSAVQSFSNEVQGADVALFYYAGHGVQVRGANYLVPVSANPTRETDVDFQLVDVSLVLRQMEGAGTKLNLVVLDACRNNPFEGRGLRASDGGLAQMRAPEGTLISYATQPGNVAQDGGDGHSPYTKALAQTIRRPGLDIFQAFNEVGLAVKRSTGGAQQPWVSSSPIDGNFYFAAAPAAQQPSAAPAGSGGDEFAWSLLKDSKDADQLRAFIAQFPGSQRRNDALGRLLTLEQAKAAERAEAQKKPAADQKVALLPTLAQPGSPCGSSSVVGVSLTSRAAAPLSAAEECGLKPKDVFKECDKCPEMVVVPSGSFIMGSPASEKERSDNEGPQHRVTFAKTFAVGRFAMTFNEWDACVAGGGCNGYRPGDEGWGRERRPVVNVSWHDAQVYVAWLSKMTGKTYRLLSEAEREYVTRAGTTTPFWWGTSLSTREANYEGSYIYADGETRAGGRKGEGRTLPVDSFAPNAWGLYQVHGNVWEFTEDCYNGSYDGAPSDGSAWKTGDCRQRVYRGGDWDNMEPRALRAALRNHGSDVRGKYFGFRVARPLAP